MPQRNPLFTGRTRTLEILHAKLAEGTTALLALPQTLYGLGGVGKTQLALEYAHRYKSEYDLVWWIDAEQPETTVRSLGELARSLNLKVSDDLHQLAEAARDALRRGVPTARWLLIFDNADDPVAVRRHFPDGPGHILVSSRTQNWSALADVLSVDVFDRAESIEHLCRRVRGLSRNDADQVADAVGDLPLAVAVASAWLDTTGMPAITYVNHLRGETTKVLAAGGAPADYPTSVGATWRVSIARLREQSPAAARLLQLCAFFAPEPISMRLFYGGQLSHALRMYDPGFEGDIMLGTAIQAIGRYALAKVDSSSNSFQVHRLVQAVVRSEMTSEEQHDATHEVHRILVRARPDIGGTDDPANWPAFEEIWPHLTPSRAHDCEEPGTRQLMIDRVQYLWRRSEYPQARRTGHLLDEAWTAKLGEDDRQTLLVRFQLANVIRSQGQYATAMELDEDTLERQRRVLGEQHPSTLMTASSLSAARRALGEFAKALELDQEILERFREQFGEDNPRTLSIANNLAIDYRLVGDSAAALELDQDTLDRRALVLGPKHPYTLSSKSNLARDLREQGDYEQSVAIHQEVDEAYAETLDIDVPEVLRNATALAVALRKAGRQAEGRRLTKETYERYLERYGENAPDTLACAVNLAADYSAAGDNDAARDLARQLYVGHQQLFGSNHPFTLACANNLGIYLRKVGEIGEAARQGEHAVAELRQALGSDHPFTLGAVVNLANAYAVQGELDRAVELGRAAYAGLCQRYSPNHPDAIASQVNLAITLRDSGHNEQGIELRARAVEESVRQLGELHSYTVAAREWKRIDLDLEPQPT
ncbi:MULTISPECIES: FxSxx-COOH system tetratricopeptide repeat protein [unclassified Kitasatospora]|uniref:FxSxx-COOH system tetratricopeptide repeat protein n=1 Tax=unclassified Kitasatospora TaxID=2633591 RepID=UPI0024760BA9|nr:FxSxx-COOH system tetratricopeptide repeat protein [Kitasatospora sp. MAP12-44]